MRLAEHTAGVQLAVRAAVAAALSMGLARWMGLPFPIYAMVSAVIVTDLDPGQTRKLSLPRLAGTLLGAGLGALICLIGGGGVWQIGLGIAVAMVLCSLVRAPAAAKVSGYVCGIVILDHGDHPWTYALYRTVETMLGIGGALGVSLVPKLIAPRPLADNPQAPRPAGMKENP